MADLKNIIMKLARSKYNIIFEHDKKKLLFNLETKVFLVLTSQLYDILSSDFPISENLIDAKSLDYLRKAKVLIESDALFDYYYQQKLKYSMDAYSQNILSLTILPTTDCNCDCFYCFEKNKPKVSMTDDVINDLMLFIKQHENAKVLDLCWYGGEPLLGFKAIQKIWNRIDQEVNLSIRNHQIITNGYLINHEIVDFFKKHPLTDIQITLDGKKDVHDSRRVLKHTNKGTFDRIIKNIKWVSEEFEHSKIKIRVNIDKNNKDDFYELKQEINSWGYKNIFIYPGFIRTSYGIKQNYICDDLTNEEIRDFYFSLNDESGASYISSSLSRHCAMTTINSYLIGPKGEIYKCWNEVGDTQRVIGNIKDEKVLNYALFAKYMTASSLFEDANCKECELMPVCTGGCPRRRINNIFKGEHHDLCCLLKNRKTLIAVLCKYYDHLCVNKNPNFALFSK